MIFTKVWQSGIGPGPVPPIPPTPFPPTPWVRPTNWLTLPSITEDEEVVMLVAIKEEYPFAFINVDGDYTVEWGDTTSNNYSSGAGTQYHQYTWADLAGTDIDGGYRQAIIRITPQVGSNLTVLDATTLPVGIPNTSPANTYLDVKVKAPNLTTLLFKNNYILEQFEFIGTNNITTFTAAFQYCYTLRNLISLYTGLGTNFSIMFNACYSLETIPTMDISAGNYFIDMFRDCYNLRDASPINFTTSQSSIDKDATGMFWNCRYLNILPTLDYSYITNTTNMFTNTAITTIPSLSLPKVLSAVSMFSTCRFLETVGVINLPVVTDLTSFFNGCSSLMSIAGINTSTSLENTSSMFQNCGTLPSVPLFTTDNVTNISGMFSACYNLKTVPNFNFDKVVTASSLFSTCYNLTTIPSLSFPAATTTAIMFSGCSSLEEITINAPITESLNYMFRFCSKLTTINGNLGSSFTTSSQTFEGCYSLKTLPTMSWASCTNINNLFNSARSISILPTINLPSTVTTINSGFTDCNLLTKLTVTNLKQTCSLANCRLNRDDLVALFTSLATVTGKTLTITGNRGVPDLSAADKLIATGKGWTLVL